MRKFILAAIALISLSGSCDAAYWQGQTYTGPPQIFYNIVTDGGASCPGDVATVTRNLTTVDGSTTISVDVDTFVSGDIGKLIILPGAGFGGNTRVTTITAVSAFAAGKQDITVALAPQSTLTGVSTIITYGTDDAPKFITFNTWARANQGANNQVVLTVPAGANCWFGSSNSVSGVTLLNAWAAGIKNLIVEGAGASLNGVNGAGFTLAGQGIIQVGLTQAGGQSARVQSVSGGATQVTLTSTSFSAGYISRFTNGRWLMISGIDPQGLWQGPFGFPPNARYFEWRQITNVNTGTGTITLDRPLVNSYLDTWPNWNDGNAFQVDQGGPATIYALNDTWNATVEYRGLTISQTGQSYAKSRNVIYRNVTFTGSLGAVPTENETWTAINSSWGLGTVLETDKLVGTMTMDNVSVPRLDFQSSSTELFILRNSTLTTMFGTPSHAEITDTIFGTFRPGATGYGETSSVVCTRCAVTTFDFDGGVLTPQSTSPFNPSMSAGVFSYPNVDESGPYPTGIVFIPPKGNVYWVGGGMLSIGLFNVQAMTQDATNAFVQTNESGGLPGVAGGITGLRTHPAQQWTCDNCTGDATMVATNIQSGATAQAPLGEFSYRNYIPSATGTQAAIKNRGRIVSLTIDVTTPSTHTGAITLNATGQFHLFTMDQSGWTQYDWVPQINLKQSGTRVITPLGTTCNGSPGGCAGDTCVQPAAPGCFTPPSTAWLPGNAITPYINGTFSGGVNPQFSMTLRTNQGVVP